MNLTNSLLSQILRKKLNYSQKINKRKLPFNRALHLLYITECMVCITNEKVELFRSSSSHANF
jgi:hypothetical protein